MSQNTFYTILTLTLVILFGFVAFAMINDKPDTDKHVIQLQPVDSEALEGIKPKTVTKSEHIDVEVR